MNEEVRGYHCEWNMGSPGGWYYQKMAQEIARHAWKRIQEKSRIDIELDFDDPILNPVPNFADLLLRAHERRFPGEKPVIALVAEAETLDKVGENIRFVEYLDNRPDVEAVLTDAAKLRLKDGEVCVGDRKVTTIFLDYNNRVIAKLKKKHDITALLSAIKQGLVTNPRGMEPLGVKGVFEAICSEYRDKLSKSTVEKTPWTRQFYRRSTTGPRGEDIPDLIRWTRENWQHVILKPVHGYSGHGIIIGHREPDTERAIKSALDSGDYIVQDLVPLKSWAEEYPWIDKEKKRLFIKQWQTDFRCFITDVGLIGFVTRFGGIPTNVGSGGGIQGTGILRSSAPVGEAIRRINEAVLKLGYDFVQKLQQEVEEKSVDVGLVYLLGPMMCTLRPRILTAAQIEQLKEYAKNLWRDSLTLEALWFEGKLKRHVQISGEEESIARLSRWRGGPALIASDGLYNFGGGLA